MNGDRLVIDRTGPNGSVSMRVVVAEKPTKAEIARDDAKLRAPMPPTRPMALLDEIREKRRQRAATAIEAEVYDCVVDYARERADAWDPSGTVFNIDSSALARDLRGLFLACSDFGTAGGSVGESVGDDTLM